ncbi:AfsR/SARP family transcriptional regulator [Plantactinospora sonchi]|uniref:Tetratricopeptide repeat protein n=1 Tax=Plantactinospora sonchi TaxID=1544735 RepID=A0ABU7S2R1_9ACTN
MEFRVLGPVQVEHHGSPVHVGRRRERCLLGLLLLEAGRPVPIHRLVDLLWQGEPPANATAVLSTYVSRLRTALNTAGDRYGDVLVRRGDGYAIEVPPDSVDAHRFTRLVELARTATDVERARLLREALALWRGTPLADAAEPLRARVCAGLDQLRRSATLLRIETDLALGGHDTVLGELAELAAREPLDEGLAGHLMLALYRSGRRQDALRTYHRTRQRLADELGLDPGAPLNRLAQAILRGDPGLDLTTTATGGSGPATDTGGDGPATDTGDPVPVTHTAGPGPTTTGTGDAGSFAGDGRGVAGRTGGAPLPRVPAQLPLNLAVFAGRQRELDQLDHILLPSGGEPAGVMIAVVSGTAGVGKSTLAVHWAHRRADRFPDGQLHVNLRGFDPSGSRVEPGQAIRGLLTALGAAPHHIPADLAEQAALYRSLLAGRRVLIMLDNAADADQVHPLLPGTPGCGVIVTSRYRLSGLVARVGAHPVTLELPPANEARQLLVQRLGPGRVAAELTAVDEIIAHCARLPLALAVAAARTAAQPGFPLRTLAEQLRSTAGGLDGFADGDPGTDVRAVFSWSYQRLTAPAARLFRLLGLHPGPDIGTAAAASLVGLPPPQVHPALAELTRANLLSEHVPGRYGCHDLLRAYAAELARKQEPAAERREAVHRVLDHYLHSAQAAARLTHPHRDAIAVDPPRPGVTAESFVDAADARCWLTVEQPVLLASIGQRSPDTAGGHTWQLAWTIAPFLDEHGHWPDLVAVLESALAAVRARGDRPGQAYALRYLGIACLRLGRHDDADGYLRQALARYAELDDHVGQAQVHHNLALVLEQRTRFPEALHHAQQALDLFETVGHRIGQARALSSVGWCHALNGTHDQALTCCYRALADQQELGDRPAEAHTWTSLGYAHHHLGQYPDAIACHQRALALFRDLGNRPAVADTLAHLGNTLHAHGQLGAARRAWLESATILDELHHPAAGEVRDRLRHTFAEAGASGTRGSAGDPARTTAKPAGPDHVRRAGEPLAG